MKTIDLKQVLFVIAIGLLFTFWMKSVIADEGHGHDHGGDSNVDVDVPVEVLPDRLTATGNVILANDTAALVHPDISDRSMEIISRVLGVDVHRGTIAGLGTVGMSGVATNKGLLVHPMVTQEELAHLEEVFDLPVDVGTTNYGSQAVGSGLLANSKGYVAGSNTTGHELGRIEDALFFD